MTVHPYLETFTTVWSDGRHGLSEIYARMWDPDVLDGRCAGCTLGRVCRAGCPAVAWGTTGTIGVNPWCLR